MSQILDLPIKDFLAATAAKQPTPGGGSVAALIGALSASLAAMALEYTVGKKAFAIHDTEMRAALSQFQSASKLFQELITEDIAAYDALSPLLKIPEEQRQQNPDYLPAVVAAIRAPQTAAGIAMNVLSSCAALIDKTNKHLLSDLALAATFAHATLHASELNVRINLPLLPNKEEAVVLRQSMSDLITKADATYAAFRAQILTRI